MTIDEAIAHAQETADTRTDLCDECREEHRQLAQWLIELKQLCEENDTLKTEIMAVKSGSDVLKICKLEEENKELKRLMRLAVDDFKTLSNEVDSRYCDFNFICKSCPFSSVSSDDNYIECVQKWKHTEEAIRILEDNNV